MGFFWLDGFLGDAEGFEGLWFRILFFVLGGGGHTCLVSWWWSFWGGVLPA